MALSWLNDPEPELPYKMRLPPALWLIPILIAIGLATVITVLVRDEMQTSRLQAEWLSWYGARIAFAVKPGPNEDLRFPDSGPYNQRLGYSYLPSFTKALETDGYDIAAQMRTSDTYDYFVDRGLYPLYHPKTTAGLTLYDRDGWQLYNASYPNRVFADYGSVPPVLTQTLLFVENRELLKDGPVTRNPVIEWDRFFYATFGHMFHGIVPGLSTGGGSTLATQIEKFRFSPGGQTMTGADKLRQIASASLRVYLDGPDTRHAREKLVLDYLNGTPLSARPGFGEVNGIGDGLWAWFGIDLADATTALNLPEHDPDSLRAKARVYRAALGLILAQRRPSYYLLTDRWALDDLTDITLDHLANVGVISDALRAAARGASFKFLAEAPPTPQPSLIEQKAVNAMRGHLMTMLGLKTLYATDRLDLAVRSTIDDATERRVVDFLKKMDSPAFLKANGFYGTRLLEEGDDPSRINWSVILYERGPDSNKIRVQADNVDEAFDMNEGMKLDLGSTAKLRTLVTYLEIVSELYRRYAGLSPVDLQDLVNDAPDVLTLWATNYLIANPDATMDQMLSAAMQRQYSADPTEVFFTGGGTHSFANFEHKEDGLTMDLHEAFRESVNCVFIRLMRDIVNYTIAQGEETKQELIDDPDQPARQHYLERFAAHEGSIFLNRYIADYADMTPTDALEKLAGRAHKGAAARTVLFRSVKPEASYADYTVFMRQQMKGETPDQNHLMQLYSAYPIARYNLSDRGYIVGVNPLELWLVGYMQSNPHASRRAIEEVSEPVLIESYSWLFNPHLKHAQDNRIRIMMEEDAFARIQKRWARLGYPFTHLVPSLATAIGSSADRPDALSELMGIIMNDGVRRPTIRFESMQFGENTPYQTLFLPGMEQAQQVLDPAIADIMKRTMIEVVNDGTAKRVKDAYANALGQPLVIGGKTGTGDQRYDEFGAGGKLISSHSVNRTGTFVFYIGDKYFGTIVAHVTGDDASKFNFSSALAVQMLKSLQPVLQPLISGTNAQAQAAAPAPVSVSLTARP
jgi:membrane peptidoglycan carboxypeptidase